MLASVTCHLHPELKYEELYPCLSYVELSAENIFDQPLLEHVYNVNIAPISKDGINERIGITRMVHDRICEHKLSQYNTNTHDWQSPVCSDIIQSTKQHEDQCFM